MRVEAKPRKVYVRLLNGETIVGHAESWILALLMQMNAREREDIAQKVTLIEEDLATNRGRILTPEGNVRLV